MNYNQALEGIKESIIEKLALVVSDEAYLANPNLPKRTYLNTIYTDIMALGYNFGDLKLAAGDIYEMQSPLFGEGKEFFKIIQMRVGETASHYPFFVEVFSDFHRKTQAGVDYEEVLDDVKLALKVV